MSCLNTEISVIIPIRNNSDSISETLRSVFRQSVDNIGLEIIVIDDASVDHGLEKCLEIESNFPIQTYKFDFNRGQSHARNFGIENSNGEFILILDADDILIEGCISLLYGEISKSKHLDLITGQRIEFGPWGMNMRRKYDERNHEELCKLISRGKNPITHSGTLFRKNWFERSGGYSSQRIHAEDMDLWYRGMNMGRFIQLDVPTIYYRQSTYYRNFAYWKSSNRARLEVLEIGTQSNSHGIRSVVNYLLYILRIFLLRQINRFGAE